jgi:8-oxo-dGTP diphosphatase
MSDASPHADDTPRHIVAVMGVVRDARGHVLLVKTQLRSWEPPGGQVELGEDPVTALSREIREESGCDVRVGRLIGVYSNVAPPQKVLFTFLCDFAGGALATSEETLDVGWFEPEEALRMVTSPPQLAKLRDAQSMEPAVIYRVYRTNPYMVLHERRC